MVTRQEERRLSRREREKKAREKVRAEKAYAREAARQAARVRYTVDVPEDIKKQMRDLAKKESVPESQLVTLAIMRLIEDVTYGRLRISDYRRPSRSPRYDWILEICREK